MLHAKIITKLLLKSGLFFETQCIMPHSMSIDRSACFGVQAFVKGTIQLQASFNA